MGWSDETEMLAKIYCLLLKKLGNNSINWEKCLPSKYVDAADYSLIDETDQSALTEQLTAGFQTYLDAAKENRKFIPK